ncbi:proton-coupled folate transporter-like [Periophthalmus magnuspinnatus]|uniref:proton-coupled folate transporter-like n=1 Tax=Periophthalmus magnuspinnatus TaxID=409849 RepID=UPI00145A035F|nr:proton-coupled folate transporter-like [Periophthalmus magnuspinnatus]
MRKISKPPFSFLQPVTVEPVILTIMLAQVLETTLLPQYLWDRVSEDVGYNSSHRSDCNSSLPIDPLQKKVQILTSRWNMYINVWGFFLSILVVPFLGSWSDKAGRRPLLIISSMGLALETVVSLVVMYRGLNLEYFLLGKMISGISGEYSSILGSSYAYIADISDKKKRTIRVAILQACYGFSGILAGIIGGIWKQTQGYIAPFWLVLAVRLASALYSYLFVCESVPVDPSVRLFSTSHHKALWKLYSTGGSQSTGCFHKYKLWLYTFCFFIVVGVHSGCKELYVLFELGSPLCWGSELIGYGSAALHLAFLSSPLWLKIMTRCLEDSWVALVGLISNIAGLLVFSAANTTPLIFTAYGILLFNITPIAVIRSKLSKLVDSSEQGTLFACMACMDSMSHLAGSAVFNSLFSATLYFMKGFSFIFAAILLLIPSVIISTVECLDKKTTWSNRNTVD